MPKTTTDALPKSQRPFIFRSSHEPIIRDALYQYHLLTAKQITRRLYPTPKLGNFTTMKQRLARLVEAKYLTSVHLPTAERPFVYCLGMRGKKYLKAEGYDVTTWFEENELLERTPGWYMHLLELNDFLISAAILEKSVPSLHLAEWLHDLTIARNSPAGLKKDGKVIEVKPDGYLHFTQSVEAQGETRTRHYRYFVELDRGSESEDKIRAKIRGYFLLSQNGTLHKHYNAYTARGEEARLIILFPTSAGQKRVATLRDYTQKELKALKTDIQESSYTNLMFQFASVPRLTEPQPDPRTLFCAPIWTPPYNESTQKTTLIELPHD